MTRKKNIFHTITFQEDKYLFHCMFLLSEETSDQAWAAKTAFSPRSSPLGNFHQAARSEESCFRRLGQAKDSWAGQHDCSPREYPVFSALVSSFRHSAGETKNLSRKHRMLSQANTTGNSPKFILSPDIKRFDLRIKPLLKLKKLETFTISQSFKLIIAKQNSLGE